MDRPIADIAVAGGGLVAWSAAAALKRRLPYLNLTIVDSPPPADSLTDNIICTLPSIAGFHSDIGLTEADTVARAGSGLRGGILFEGWSADHPAYVHAYGNYGEPLGPIAFHQLWLRASGEASTVPFDHYSAPAELARRGRLAVASAESEYGLQLNLDRYRRLLRDYALHLGVVERSAAVVDVQLRSADGFVEGLRLDDGGLLTADLFVDCTGPSASIHALLDDRFEEWSSWLPCDRLLIGRSPAPVELPVLDRAVAVPIGWRWEAASPAQTSHGLVYSSVHADDADAARLLEDTGATIEGDAVQLRQGRRPEPWLRNCVAVGEAAVGVEPLEWTNLHLAHSAIDRIVSMMPDRECSSIELAEYNRQCTAEADRIRDFLCLHYVSARRPGDPFWEEAARIEPPASLAHTLGLFEERGRLPFYEEETFSRDSWLAVLLGQGVTPRRVDPLVDLVPVAEAGEAMTRIRASIAAAVATQPTASVYLRNLFEQAVR